MLCDRPVTDHPGWVYFAGSTEKAPIKIGWSGERPDLRVASLQTAFPYRLSVLACVVGSPGDEAKLHKRFASCRCRQDGEWFERSEALMAVVAFLRGEASNPPLDLAWFLGRRRWRGPIARRPAPPPPIPPTPSKEELLAIRRARSKRLRALCEQPGALVKAR